MLAPGAGTSKVPVHLGSKLSRQFPCIFPRNANRHSTNIAGGNVLTGPKPIAECKLNTICTLPDAKRRILIFGLFHIIEVLESVRETTRRRRLALGFEKLFDQTQYGPPIFLRKSHFNVVVFSIKTAECGTYDDTNVTRPIKVVQPQFRQ
jgi:hypothetical protein